MGTGRARRSLLTRLLDVVLGRCARTETHVHQLSCGAACFDNYAPLAAEAARRADARTRDSR